MRSALALAALLIGLAACGGDGEAATTTTTSTSAPPSSVSTTAAPASSSTSTSTTASTVPPTTAPPPPVAVLVTGDSVGYTLGEYAPATVPGVTGVVDRALPGCGLITSGPRPADAVAAGAPATYDDCGIGIADADAAGLATGPDVVLLVTGAWERSDHERDGRTVGPGDEAWTASLRDLLRARVETLAAGGARVALWVDPCGQDDEVRRRQAWYRDEVVVPTAEASGAVVVDPTDVACAGDEPAEVEGVGNPRPDDGQHWSEAGAAWLWTTWLGPTLAAAAAG